MPPLLSTTPALEAAYVGNLPAGSWALVFPPRSESGEWRLMLCLKQHETTKTTFVLFDGQHTGINHVNYQNIPALVLPNEVDVSFHLSELENGPHEQAAIERPILAVDNTGRYLIVFDQLTGQEHSVNLETGAIEGRRRPLCWTKTFTLRCRSNPGEPWSEVLRLGADTDEP